MLPQTPNSAPIPTHPNHTGGTTKLLLLDSYCLPIAHTLIHHHHIRASGAHAVIMPMCDLHPGSTPHTNYWRAGHQPVSTTFNKKEKK
ncbi:hypothetical protein CGERO_00660 [Corynebacterium gerontici]|uniref:Uncharacterized protein n=1 Tax=Corynebacterium gerontici TaxID=2079234 RepID=A0A3G6IXG9_9CORY|nr:hypothetical protein CGERO_00660 [Corynebacterium gerontici]